MKVNTSRVSGLSDVSLNDWLGTAMYKIRLYVSSEQRRYDSDTALNHKFFWSDPDPEDLGKMLGQHTQSMFEYLAPPRRGAHQRQQHHQGQAGPAGVASRQPASSLDGGYQDRVF